MAELAVKGMKELRNKLRALGPAAGGKALRNAASFAMTPVVQEARRRAPVGDQPHKTYKGRVVAPGFLSRNIKKKARMLRDKSTVFVHVGMAGEAWYGGLLEDGTKYMDANPWLEPAFEARKNEVLERFTDKLRQNIEKAARTGK